MMASGGTSVCNSEWKGTDVVILVLNDMEQAR